LSILKTLLKENLQRNRRQKIQDLYATYMIWKKRNADGITPIKADLAKIDAIKTVADLQKYLLLLHPTAKILSTVGR
jgi:putative endopeptidase